MANNKNFQDILDKLSSSEEIKQVDVNIQDLTNHEECKRLNITMQEAKDNLFLIKSIIDELEDCKLSRDEGCVNPLGYHRHLERNNGQISVIAKICPKKIKVDEKYSYKKNFIYDSFANQDISKVLLSKEYFNTEVDITVKNIVDRYKAMIQKDEYTGMYIYGTFGIGKTYLSMAIANDYAKRTGKKVAFIYLADLVSKIKTGFNDQEIQAKVLNLIEEIKEVDLVFFDDIGSESASDWFYSEYLLNILNERVTGNKLTFFNSNFSLDELEKYIKGKIKNYENASIITGRLMDRIRSLVGNESILMRGKNRRY